VIATGVEPKTEVPAVGVTVRTAGVKLTVVSALWRAGFVPSPNLNAYTSQVPAVVDVSVVPLRVQWLLAPNAVNANVSGFVVRHEVMQLAVNFREVPYVLKTVSTLKGVFAGGATVNDWVTLAAGRKAMVPGSLKTKVQSPTPTNSTTFEVTVHDDVVVEVTCTVDPEFELTTGAYSPPTAASVGAVDVRVIVLADWAPLLGCQFHVTIVIPCPHHTEQMLGIGELVVPGG